MTVTHLVIEHYLGIERTAEAFIIDVRLGDRRTAAQKKSFTRRLRMDCGNAGGSLIEDAKIRGVLKPGMTIVEATCGNSGSGRFHGLRFINSCLRNPRAFPRRKILCQPETGYSRLTPSARSRI